MKNDADWLLWTCYSPATRRHESCGQWPSCRRARSRTINTAVYRTHICLLKKKKKKKKKYSALIPLLRV
eukprot:TRINITY_DN1604_c0_g2_i1.p2 TRINITY_DN1604_c0_g2~~TRINITY_DN1604_c0_g2_i1.p2  ORF type:complete len:69 (-),score=41.40 TRINITY_DN1604_c0_g2_i1:2-208(-)